MLGPDHEAVSQERSRLDRKLWLKYLLDKVVAAAFLPPLLLLMAAVRLAMWLESSLDPSAAGPLLYVEERWTQGHPFQILKLRTSYPGSQQAGTVGRITRLGFWLRKWYLDEAPQIINILRGEMTLVGPRPNVPKFAQREIEEEGMRGKLLLRAGLTGLVQVHKRAARDRGRYRTLEDEYLERVQRLSPWGVVCYDANLMLQTIPFMLRGEGL